MDRIALISGEIIIYWRSLLLAAGAASAIFLFLAIYLNKKEHAVSAALAIPMAMILGIFISRLVHWYTRPDTYQSFAAAVTNFQSGGFALIGVFAGCLLTVAVLYAAKVCPAPGRMLDAMSIAGCVGISVGRLTSLFDISDRGLVIQQLQKLPWVYPTVNSVSGVTEYRLATFLLQAMIAALLFILLLITYIRQHNDRKYRNGDCFLLFLLIYGASQVILDSTRYDSLYFRSNGFVSIVQIFSALAILFTMIVFSVRMVKAGHPMKVCVPLWILTAAGLGMAGYMEYYVQRHGYKAAFSYTVMTASLLVVVLIGVFIRHLGYLSVRKAVRSGKFLPAARINEKKIPRKIPKAVYVAVGSCAVCAVALAVLLSSFVWTGSGFTSRKATNLDLRGKSIRLSEYEQLKAKLPDCQILWDVPFQDTQYPSTSTELTITQLSQDDVAMLAHFPQLQVLNAMDCKDYPQLLQAAKQYPQCQVLYQVRVDGTDISCTDTEVTLENASVSVLSEQLAYLPALKSLHLKGSLPQADALLALCDAYPQVDISWEIMLEDELLDSHTKKLDLSGTTLAFEQIETSLAFFPNLEEVDITNTGFTQQQLHSLVLAFPDCFFLWEAEIAGKTFLTDSQEIDISGQKVSSPEEVEKMLPCFPKLTKVVMSRCGLDDETMDALDKRYDDIRFVWSVKINNYYIRTDATYFYPYKLKKDLYVEDKDVYPLRYCVDMVCIDVGHMFGITNCDWAAYMPNLKYLIIGETNISDLTPLSNCKNLIYLELFTIPVTDYSPLIGCTALEDLNLGRTFGDPTPLTQMTWLKNVWWANVHGTVGLPCSNAKAVLTAALPNTNLRFDLAHPTASGWRQLKNYYAMRDYMGMFYLS